MSIEQLSALGQNDAHVLSPSGISAIERGRNLPSIEALLFYESTLLVDPSEIIERVKLATGRRIDVSSSTAEQLDAEGCAALARGDHREALAAFDAAVDRLNLESEAPTNARRRMRATLELRRAGALRRLDALRAARTSAERAITLASETPDIQAECYVLLAWIHSQFGNSVLAEDLSNRALEIGRDANDRARCHALMCKAEFALEGGRFGEARKLFTEAKEIVSRINDQYHAVHVEGAIGVCWAGLGKRSEAMRWVRQAVQMAHERGYAAREAYWRVKLGELCLATGELGEAQRLASEALLAAQRIESLVTVFSAEWLLHQINKKRNPESRDERRVARLQRMAPRLREHLGESAVREFLATYGEARRASEGE